MPCDKGPALDAIPPFPMKLLHFLTDRRTDAEIRALPPAERLEIARRELRGVGLLLALSVAATCGALLVAALTLFP